MDPATLMQVCSKLGVTTRRSLDAAWEEGRPLPRGSDWKPR